LSTKPVGSPTSFDAQMGDWHPANPRNPCPSPIACANDQFMRLI
jgi:hypothetical protein